MRIYDPRLGRFLKVDPLYKSYPELSTYQYASNSPIENIDLDGLEKYSFHLRTLNGTEQIVKVETDNSLKYKCTPLIASIPTTKPKVAEFIYEDEKGNVISKTAEIPLKNFGSTIYVGPWNPKKEDGKTDDYKLPAINSLDAAAKKHDLAYDKVQAIGFEGALLDLKTLPADKELVKDASLVVAMYYLNITDPVNNQPISGNERCCC